MNSKKHNSLEEIIENIIRARKNLDNMRGKMSENIILNQYSYDDKEFLQRQIEILEDSDEYKPSMVIESALDKLKEEKHPEINGAKYYKKYIDRLSVEMTEGEKRELDDELFKNYNPRYVYASINIGKPSAYEHKILKELYEMGVIEPMISVSCACGNELHVVNASKEISIVEKLGISDMAGENDTGEILEEITTMLNCYDCDNEYMEWEDQINLAKRALQLYDSPQSFYRFKVAKAPDMTITNL